MVQRSHILSQCNVFLVTQLNFVLLLRIGYCYFILALSFSDKNVYVLCGLCTIWYHLYNLENTKNTYGGLLFLVKLHASACNSTESNTPPLMFFTFLNLYEWYQIQLLCVSFNCFCSSLKKKRKLPGSAIIQAHCQ